MVCKLGRVARFEPETFHCFLAENTAAESNMNEQRNIFRISIAGRELYFDPLVLWRRLFSGREIEIFESIQVFESENLPANDRDEAREKFIQIIREAMDLPKLDSEGNGYAESEVENAFYSFVAYMDKLKKKLDSPPKSSQLLDTNDSTNSSTSIMKHDSGCSSKETSSEKCEAGFTSTRSEHQKVTLT